MDALIFHIALVDEWEAATHAGSYRTSTRGSTLEEVSFIHCSHRHQIERIANLAYRDAGPICVLAIDPERLGATEVREESGGGVETFPHLYGPLPVGAVVGVSDLAPTAGGLFVPTSSWLSSKLEVRRSPIDGFGLFANAAIALDEPLAVMGGRVMTTPEFERHIAGLDEYGAAAIDEGLDVLQSDDDPLTRGNHSCDPDVWMADELTLVARRTIGPGTEATVDYALMTVAEDWSMVCRCGTEACRGTITGTDWHLPDLQHRYTGHFSPFVGRRIAALNGTENAGSE